MDREGCVRWFDDIRLKNVPAVGGKTALLGEQRALLKGRVLDGFASTAQAYGAATCAAGIESELRRVLADFDYRYAAVLADRAATVRTIYYLS